MGPRGGRVQRSSEERRRVVERFASSGLSAQAFCRREGIAPANLARWRSLTGSEGRTDFVEWTPSAGSSSTTLAPGEMELVFPGGVRLRFRA
jgi:transposase-like protein